MLNRKVWPLLLMVLFGGVFWAFTGRDTDASGDSNEDKYAKQQKLLTSIGNILEERHYSPKLLNDSFSQVVFVKFLDNLDPDKSLFLQQDIKDLDKFRTTIDDEILGKSGIQFYPSTTEVYRKRMDEAIAIYRELLSRPFDFSKNETAQLDGEKLNFPANDAARKEYWRKRLKFLTLERFYDLQQQREKAAPADSISKKSDADLEKDARKMVLTSLDRNYNRLKLLFTNDQQFSTFVNTITELMDPHTEYYPPVEKREFDESMSGRFYGIGAQLKEEDGAIKIASLVTGSPAWKSGKVQPNDEILKVAQGNDAPVDVAGYAVTDVVKLIRGSKGSEVKITFKKADGTIQVVSMVRDEIVLDETFARSSIIKEGDKKVGYIFLPEFYADLERENGNRCSEDVAEEVNKLKAENVDGIIIDLRNNGGGSLYEVVQMVGLFIKGGPVVQVRDRSGKPRLWNDNDESVIYDGPLAVMVNEFSASASEIFAAAIQDYHRGIVVGSTSTYGKGTVQTPIPLGKVDMMSGQTEYGALKITFQKFYRVDGGSTQLKGVSSDIVLPDSYEYLRFREKDNPSALSWDHIPQAKYAVAVPDGAMADVIKKANDRIQKTTAFSLIKNNTEWLSKNADKEVELGLEAYKKQQNMLKNTVKQNDALAKLKDPMNMYPLDADKEKFYNNPDKSKGERYQQWLKNIQSDIYINETVNVVKDMIELHQNNTAKQ